MEQQDPNQIPNQQPVQNTNPFSANMQPPVPQPDPQVPQPENPSPKKGHLKLFLVIVIAVIVLLFAFFAAKVYIFKSGNQDQSTQQSVQNVSLLPPELADYDIGQNADSFAVFKSNQDVQNLLLENDFTKPFASIKAILYLLNSGNQSSVVILKTDTADNAQKLKDSITNQSSLNPLSTYRISQKDNTVIAEMGNGLADFSGKLSDNSDYVNFPIPASSNYFVINFNHQKTPELSQIYFSPINSILNNNLFNSAITPTQETTATSATTAVITQQASPSNQLRDSLDGLLNFIKSSQVTASLDSNGLNINTKWNLLADSEMDQSVLYQAANKSSQQLSTQEELTLFNQLKNNLVKEVPALSTDSKPVNLQISFADNTITFNLKDVQQDLESNLQNLSSNADNSVSKTQDMARINDLNKIVSALETYKVDHDKYPASSACVDKMQELKTYFTDGGFPADPSGTQTIGTLDCTNGYYYQAFDGGSRYIIWSKVANQKDGNTYKEPETIATSGFDMLKTDFDGGYFVIKMDSDSMVSKPTQAVTAPIGMPRKFKRTK